MIERDGVVVDKLFGNLLTFFEDICVVELDGGFEPVGELTVADVVGVGVGVGVCHFEEQGRCRVEMSEMCMVERQRQAGELGREGLCRS